MMICKLMLTQLGLIGGAQGVIPRERGDFDRIRTH